MSELPHLMLSPRSGRARSWKKLSWLSMVSLVLAFQDLEQQRELGDLDGLRVDVHAVDVVEQDALSLGGGQPPVAAAALVETGCFWCTSPGRASTYQSRCQSSRYW